MYKIKHPQRLTKGHSRSIVYKYRHVQANHPQYRAFSLLTQSTQRYTSFRSNFYEPVITFPLTLVVILRAKRLPLEKRTSFKRPLILRLILVRKRTVAAKISRQEPDDSRVRDLDKGRISPGQGGAMWFFFFFSFFQSQYIY